MDNRVSRRQMISLLFTASASGALFKYAPLLDAIEQFGDGSDVRDRIATIVRLGREVMLANEAGVSRETSTVLFERMLTFALSAFKGDMGMARLQVWMLVRRHKRLDLHVEKMPEDKLLAMSEAVIPFAVTFSLIKQHAIKFDSRQAPSFDQLAKRMRGFVLDPEIQSTRLPFLLDRLTTEIVAYRFGDGQGFGELEFEYASHAYTCSVQPFAVLNGNESDLPPAILDFVRAWCDSRGEAVSRFAAGDLPKNEFLALAAAESPQLASMEA